MGVLKLVLGIAAIVLGILVLAGGRVFGLSPVELAGAGCACAGGAALL